MNEDAIRTTVDGHSCVIGGVRYDFRLEWAAAEKYVDPALARYLLCVEVLPSAGATHDASACLHLFAWVAREVELPSLLTHALQAQLSGQSVNSARTVQVSA